MNKLKLLLRQTMLQLFVVLIALVFGLSNAFAGMYVFPKQGQSQQQQFSDDGECRSWAIRETGVDPAYLQGQMAMLSNQPAQRDMPVARGALRGVAAGAAMGGIRNNMDEGAGRGATMGVTYGAMKGMANRRDMVRQESANQANQQMAGLQASQDSYMRAFAACMDAKGYSVK